MHFTIMSVLRNCLLFYKFSTSPWLKTSVHSLSAVPSSNATLFFLVVLSSLNYKILHEYKMIPCSYHVN